MAELTFWEGKSIYLSLLNIGTCFVARNNQFSLPPCPTIVISGELYERKHADFEYGSQVFDKPMLP